MLAHSLVFVVRVVQGRLRTKKKWSCLCDAPQEYRDRAEKIQRWLSRRWLYNIPRSLETEGLRPLGRLALVDHAQRTLQRIRVALNTAIDPNSAQQSEDTLGTPIDPTSVRVFIVSSISGGTGSGMSLDLGYAVRHAVERMGLTRAEITGIFTHSLGSETRQSELAKVNAYSWLTEFRHFSQPDVAYPGDEGAGLPSFPVGVAPFDNTYLLRWEDGMGQEAFRRSSEALAEYLYLDALTPAEQFFQGCRQTSKASGNDITLRTFNIERLSAAEETQMERLAAAVSRQVVLNWSGGTAGCASQRSWKPSALAEQAPVDTPPDFLTTDTNQLVHGAAQFIAQSQLNLDGLGSATREVMSARFDGKVERFFVKTLSSVEAAGTQLDTPTAKRIADELFSDLNIENFEKGVRIMGDPVDRVVGPLGLKLAGDLRRWLLAKLDDRQERLPGAKRAVAWLHDHFEAVARDAQRLIDRLGTQAASATQKIVQTGSPKQHANTISPEMLEELLSYVRLRLDHASVLAARVLAATLVSELKSLSETLVEFGRHLNHVAEAIQRSDDATDEDSTALPPIDEWLDPAMKACLPELAAEVDETVHGGFLAENGGLLETVMSNSRVRAGLMSTIRDRSREAVQRQMQQQNLSDRLAGENKDASQANQAAQPELMKYGGKLRHLVVLPSAGQTTTEEAAGSPFDPGNAFPNETAVVTDARADFSLCCEAAELPLVPLAVDIIDSRRDYAEYAARVQSRKDIDWQPLVAPTAPPSVPAWESLCYNADIPPVTQMS